MTIFTRLFISKSRLNSIPLKQYGITYKIDKQHNKVKIQGLGSLRVFELRQISEDMEIANGFLVKKADGYYLHIACYKQKEKITEIEKPIAIDFGIENREHLNIQRIKKEVQNKIIALAKRYSRVIFQDDNIKSWHEGWFSKQVQYSGV